MPDTSSARIGRAVAPRVSSSRCPTRESKFRLRVKWFKTGRNFFQRDSFHPPASKTGAGAEDDSESGMLCPESLNANKKDLTPFGPACCYVHFDLVAIAPLHLRELPDLFLKNILLAFQV